jgi:hypothetical protein
MGCAKGLFGCASDVMVEGTAKQRNKTVPLLGTEDHRFSYYLTGLMIMVFIFHREYQVWKQGNKWAR